MVLTEELKTVLEDFVAVVEPADFVVNPIDVLVEACVAGPAEEYLEVVDKAKVVDPDTSVCPEGSII